MGQAYKPGETGGNSVAKLACMASRVWVTIRVRGPAELFFNPLSGRFLGCVPRRPPYCGRSQRFPFWTSGRFFARSLPATGRF